ERLADRRSQQHVEGPLVLPADRLRHPGLLQPPEASVQLLPERAASFQAAGIDVGGQPEGLLVELLLAGLLDLGREVLVPGLAAGAERVVLPAEPAADEQVLWGRP